MSTDFSNARIARERSGDQADEHSGRAIRTQIASSVDSLIMKAALPLCSMHFEAAAERRRFGCRDRAGPCRRLFKSSSRLRRKLLGVGVPGRLNVRDETEHDSGCRCGRT
jgi:hypothetical protein